MGFYLEKHAKWLNSEFLPGPLSSVLVMESLFGVILVFWKVKFGVSLSFMHTERQRDFPHGHQEGQGVPEQASPPAETFFAVLPADMASLWVH